jgi:hypothetical protein
MGVDRDIEALRTENLETRLSLRKFVCASLELEFEYAQTPMEKSALRRRLVSARQACYVLEFALDLLKREQELSSDVYRKQVET